MANVTTVNGSIIVKNVNDEALDIIDRLIKQDYDLYYYTRAKKVRTLNDYEQVRYHFDGLGRWQYLNNIEWMFNNSTDINEELAREMGKKKNGVVRVIYKEINNGDEIITLNIVDVTSNGKKLIVEEYRNDFENTVKNIQNMFGVDRKEAIHLKTII